MNKNLTSKTLYGGLRRVSSLIESVIVSSPVALPAAISGLSLVLITLLLVGHLTSLLVILFGVPVFFGILIYVHKNGDVSRPGGLREKKVIDHIVFIGVMLWALFNIGMSSQSVFVYRDPAIYAVSGIELIDNSSLELRIPDIFRNIVGVDGNSAGFGIDKNDSDRLVPQGLRLLPIYIGLTGRVFGEELALSINPVFGAVALLAVYGFARLLVRPRWAALSTLVLAISLPMLYFSRDTFTEPLLLTSTFSGLTLLYLAQRQNKSGLWFLAGVAFGSGVLARIDGFLSFICLVAFFVLFLIYQTKNKLYHLKNVGLLMGGIAIASTLSYLDLTLIGNNYQSLTRKKMLEAFLLVVVFGIIAVLVYWYTPFSRFVKKIDRRTITTMSVGILVFGGFLLISRPLWYVGHHSKDIPLVAGLQRTEGDMIDTTRDYSEYTVNWIAWYIGPVMVVMGGIGLILCVVKVTKDDELVYLPLIFVIFGTSLVFLNKPSITPDQVWASRRLLPVIIPGVVVFAAIALNAIHDAKYRHKIKSGVLLFVVLAAILPPLFVSYPFLSIKTKDGQLEQIRSVCSALPSNAAVMWIGNRGFNAVQATSTFCNVPVVRSKNPSNAYVQKIMESLKEDNKTLVVTVFDTEKHLLPSNMTTFKSVTVSYESIASSLHHPPRRTVNQTKTILLANQPN